MHSCLLAQFSQPFASLAARSTASFGSLQCVQSVLSEARAHTHASRSLAELAPHAPRNLLLFVYAQNSPIYSFGPR